MQNPKNKKQNISAIARGFLVMLLFSALPVCLLGLRAAILGVLGLFWLSVVKSFPRRFLMIFYSGVSNVDMFSKIDVGRKEFLYGLDSGAFH